MFKSIYFNDHNLNETEDPSPVYFNNQDEKKEKEKINSYSYCLMG